MGRVNLTLNSDTEILLERHAKKRGLARAQLARECIEAGLAAAETAERDRKLARDYAEGRADVAELLGELEATQLELVDEEEA